MTLTRELDAEEPKNLFLLSFFFQKIVSSPVFRNIKRIV